MAKLGKRIQDGQFIEMAELLPDFRSSLNAADEDQLKSLKFKKWEITNIASNLVCTLPPSPVGREQNFGDNLSLVNVINKGLEKDLIVIHLLHCFCAGRTCDLMWPS